ncbi:conserved exported hypothetical protein [Flavobacterium sp. 9AF]|uniref:T9SS type A sorting domain-containing protein n=1 Tax=Flavobacterium sp. 9AF TaxID=2653142 RepID=UPI0012F0D716|nr:T9SS type A sorting domain-containing protein [Flavobacterium sp. 9AF]VXB93923.1 conserved exported hypothetical protein [Flavobacterium sp. 9AF]
MKKNYFPFLIFIICFGFSSAVAQNSTNSSGGEIVSGAQGSLSYSVGQIVYTTNFGTTGSVAQGVQQPYEISEVLSIDNFSNLIQEVKIFPNPTSDILTLNFINSNNHSIDYELIDINGKRLKSEKNIPNEINISIASFPSTIYYLKIKHQDSEVKTFKIIKK